MKSTQTLYTHVGTLEKLRACFTIFISTLFLMSFLGAAQAQTTLFWNPQGTAGPSDGSGNWDDTTVSNWFNGSSNVVWATTAGTNAIIGAGVPGTYNITNIATVNALTMTFSNANGYTISGAQITINAAGTTSGLISQPNTTNTITSLFRMNGGSDITNAPNSQLTLSGGGSSTGNPRLEGVSQSNSTVLMNGGTFANGSGGFLVAGVTLNITNATVNGGARVDIGRNQISGQTVAQAAGTINVLNGGQLNANITGGNNAGNHLQISRGTPAVLNVYPGGLVSTLVWSGITTPNTSPSGNLRILPDSSSQGTLNVLGGTVLVGLGATGVNGSAGSYSFALLSLTFFDAAPGVNASSRAILNMTDGSITANQIAFTTPGSVATSPTNGINITGGTLYLGAPNVSYPVSGTGTNFFFNLSGGTVSAIQNWSPPCSAPINLTNVNGNITFQAADINGTTFNMAFSGPLKGVGGFNKTGSGILTLSGANNYTGTTVVSNGTLVVSTLNSPISGAVSVEGATVAAGLPINSVVIASSGQSWTVGGDLTYDTGAPTADFNYGSFGPSTTVPAIQVNGNLNFNVTPQVTVEGSAIPVGVYPLIKYTGALAGTYPTTAVLSGNTYSGYVTNFTATKTIALVITNSPIVNGLVWAVGNGMWDFAAQNWKSNGVLAAYSNPQPVTFDDTASGPFPATVTVATTVSPGGMTISAANSYTITGPGTIAGSGSLTKSGNGILTLSGTNTYNGGTTVELGGGTLSINYGGDGVNNSAIGTGPLTLKTGAKIDNTSGQPVTLLTPITQFWNDDWTFVGTGNLNLGAAPVTLGNGQVVLTVVSNILEVDGQISGVADGIQKQGNGTLTLSNLNTFSGGMDVEAGTLNINSDGAIGSGTLTLANNATIDNTSGTPVTLNNGPSSIIVKGFTFLGTTNLDIGAAPISVLSSIVNVSNNTLFVEGALNGASTSLTKNGPGAITIGGSASSGSVTFNINAGTINLNRQPGFIGINAQGVNVNTNAALVILNPSGSQFFQSVMTLNGGLVEWNGDSETLGSLAFNSGILRDSNPTTAQLSLVAGGLVTLGGVADFDITNGATLTINGVVAGTNAANVLLKTGAGTLILATNTTYAGNTTVSNGTLNLTYATLPTNSTVTIATNAILSLNFTNADTNVVGALILNGTNASAGLHNATTDPVYITGNGNLLVISQSTINPNPGAIQFSVSGSTLNLAWPTNAGWLLQAETNPPNVGVNGSNWITLPGSDAITNLGVTINPTNGPTFYRLLHP